ncbi:MAG: hypothetical protein V1816_15680 [Pseudomonadota bacterium]
MRQSILAPLCSAFILPGLGQVLNRQLLKGFALMSAVTAIFLALLFKLLFDLSAVLGEVMGADFSLGAEQWPLILNGMRSRNMTLVYLLAGVGAALWAYGVLDAYIHGRRFQAEK